jgi:hypothetical protein
MKQLFVVKLSLENEGMDYLFLNMNEAILPLTYGPLDSH